ncbi:hypothetical protein GCM10009661_18140 [Catellatospora chokoriensis]|uniref:Restriction endonuclease n=2 Tax=Catellatospora chokoriensis TaxID=310353 RepID=A0A8J3K8N8_9ACTN|nr:hypothetical protein Cch02nite_61590 [Catellatospora chokoriensis]
MLIRGFYEEPELVASISELAPTFQVIEDFGEVRQEEWDMVVTDQNITDCKPHLFVIYFGGLQERELVDTGYSWANNVVCETGFVSREYARVTGLSEAISALVHEQLEPVLKARTSHIVFTAEPKMSFASGMDFGQGPMPKRVERPKVVIDPFILAGDGAQILAGRYKRMSQPSEVWLVPQDVPDYLVWVQGAMAEWYRLDSTRFPGVPDWTRDSRWLTSAELEVRERQTRVTDRRTKLLAELEAELTDLKQEMAEARELADNYERALLTTQSEPLVEAVAKAFTELGFDVVNADEAAESRDFLEDLHITDPDDPGWIAIAEVKGYTKGAKTEALVQFVRFNNRYHQRYGRLPTACWYVVNQFLARDPGSRQPVLHGKDDDVKAFGESNGLVIDTVILFGLLRSVRQGAYTASQARSALRASTGRLSEAAIEQALPN